MKIVILSSPVAIIANELTSLEAIATTGIDRIHFRKPRLSNKALLAILDSFSPTLLAKTVLHLNEPYNLASLERFDLKGFHVKETVRNLPAIVHWINQLPNKDQLVWSTSSHTIAELEKLPYWITHSFLSPVFSSISKESYGAKIGRAHV